MCYLSRGGFPHSPSVDSLGSFTGDIWGRHTYSLSAQNTMLSPVCPFARVFLAAWDTVVSLHPVGLLRLNYISQSSLPHMCLVRVTGETYRRFELQEALVLLTP